MTVMMSRPSEDVPQWLRAVLSEASLPGARSATRLQGRNENYLVPTSAGPLVIKRLTGPARRERYARSIGHASLVPTMPTVATPELVHASETHCALVFRELPESVSGNQLLVDERFTPALCADVGQTLARLHRTDCVQVPALPDPTPSLPSAAALSALPLEAVHRFTAGEVEAWRLIHADATLIEHLTDLGEQTAAAPRTCTHGDFRIDQVLVSGDRAHVVDWEEFGPGDPAFDTGSWLGEWVYRAALDIPTARGDGIGTGEEHGVLAHRSLTAPEIIRRGVAKLDALSPQIVAFWDAYRQEREVTPDELGRVLGFAGWHLVERLLALAQVKAVLPGVARAAAGIGRRLLTDPPAAAQALGLNPSTILTEAVA